MDVREVQFSGLRIGYRQAGTGPPLVGWAEDLRAGISNAELVVIPDVGHLANVEPPAAFNDQVRRFIRSVIES
jgi:pimeloyl-ACP methyl ester carboxylesterase